jgi:hypothetical protein
MVLNRELSHATGVNLGMSLTLAGGVTVSVRLRKGRSSLYVPISINRAALDPMAILVGLAAQGVANLALALVLRPMEKLRVQRDLRMLEKELGEELGRARRRAASQVRLMRAAAERKRAEEEADEQGGLVVLRAR